VKDSVDKIIETYFRCVTKETFSWKGITYKPKPLVVSPSIFRGLYCPDSCGACCHPYSMDYLMDETMPDIPLEPREIIFKGKPIIIFSDTQLDVTGYHCRHMDKIGRCMIHEHNAFSCDFELIRFLIFKEDKPNRLIGKLYGRGWNMLRCDGVRGALCKMIEPTEESKADAILKLCRLAQWCDYFGLEHKVNDIIDWAISNKSNEKIII
jgi:hypothetical protein